jgi:hypothetical protein
MLESKIFTTEFFLFLYKCLIMLCYSVPHYKIKMEDLGCFYKIVLFLLLNFDYTEV